MKFDKKNLNSGAKQSSENNVSAEKSRKMMRKEKRQEKKAKKRAYYQKNVTIASNNKPQDIKKIVNNYNKQIKRPKQNKTKNMDDQFINEYEKKLGIKSKDKSYKKMAKSLGYDQDLFQYLDGIANNTQKLQTDQQNEQFNDAQFDEQMEQQFDQIQNMQIQQVQTIYQKNLNVIQNKKKQAEQDSLKTQEQNAQRLKAQIMKGMNSLFNKLSDGNLLIMFRGFINIFQSHPRFYTIPIFCQLFQKFNIMVEKPLMHVFTTNMALCAGLAKFIGNRLIAPLLKQTSISFLSFAQSQEDQQQIIELGYSRMFEKCKNYVSMVAYLFEFNCICGEFVESLTAHLSRKLSKRNIQLIYIIIQRCGIKIRRDNPSIFKQILECIKTAIKDYKAEDSDSTIKVQIIQKQLNQIRFNRKSIFQQDQRMGFLKTFLQKSVPKQVPCVTQYLMVSFDRVVSADTLKTNWWDQDEHEQVQQIETAIQNKQNKELISLAKSFQMVTEAKKNIFIQLLDSQDYVQATQRILALKVKNMQQIATVLVQVCTLQPIFNPYYVMVAAQIAHSIPKFRLNIQYALWDHIKLLTSYTLRQTITLAKFFARIVAEPNANCSLSMLKCFNDLTNLTPIENVFVTSIFKEVFKRIKKQYLTKLIGKLHEQNNRGIKQSIRQYLAQFVIECRQQKYCHKVQFCRKLLEIQQKQYE